MRLRMRWLGAVCVLAAASSVSAQELTDRITINGYTNFEFERQIQKEGFGDANGSFDADQFDLVFNVHASDRVRVAADLSWEHGTATEDGRGNQALEYGFVEYTVSNLFKVRVGKMLTPFGIFNEIHTAKPAFLSVKEANSLNKTERTVKGAYHYYPRWGSGIEIHGDGVLGGNDFNYDVLVANGEQEDTNPFEEDDNKAKSLTARFRYEPTESLRVGTSFFYDKITGEPGFDHQVSGGLEFEWTREHFRLQAEAAAGWKKPLQSESVRQHSFYVQPSWHFDNGLTPYVRYDWVEPNAERAHDTGWTLVTGLNYELAKNLQIKVENDHFQGGTATTFGSLPGRHYDEIKSAVVLGF